MKKLILILAVLWFGLTAFQNSVKADDYNKAVIGHVIQSKVNGTNVDVNALIAFKQKKEQFLNSLGMKFDIDMIKLNKVIKSTEFEEMKTLEQKETFTEAMIDEKTGRRKIFFNQLLQISFN